MASEINPYQFLGFGATSVLGRRDVDVRSLCEEVLRVAENWRDEAGRIHSVFRQSMMRAGILND